MCSVSCFRTVFGSSSSLGLRTGSLFGRFRIGLSLCLVGAVTVAGIAPIRAATLMPGDILVADASGLIRVDPVTGDRILISGDERGTGPAFEHLTDVAVDVRGRIYVTNRGFEFPVFQVDPSTGDRRVVTGQGIGSGPSIGGTSIMLDVERDGSILVGNTGITESVVRVDPMTGNRETLSGSGIGDGHPFVDLEGIAVNDAGDIFVGDEGDPGPPVVLHVDPTSGDRDLVTGGGIGDGPHLTPEHITVDDNGDILAVGSDMVMRVNVETGDREMLSGFGVGNGPEFDVLVGIEVDSNGFVLITDLSMRTVLRIDPASGDRTILSGSGQGTGLVFVEPAGIAVYQVPEPSSLVLCALILGYLCCTVFSPTRRGGKASHRFVIHRPAAPV